MKNKSLFDQFHVPGEFSRLLLVIAFALALAPYLGGVDLGVLKIPSFPGEINTWLRGIGPIVFVMLVSGFLPILPGAPNRDKDAWIAVLESRASEMIGAMEQQKEDLMSDLREYQRTHPDSGEDFMRSRARNLRKLDIAKDLLLDLHKQCIAAIRADQLVVAHELVGRINHLVAIRGTIVGTTRPGFGGYASSGGLIDWESTNVYPGPAPLDEAGRPIGSKIWPAEYIKERISLSVFDPKQRIKVQNELDVRSDVRSQE